MHREIIGMRVDKIISNLQLSEASKNVNQRVFLNLEPDVFVKKREPLSVKQSFLNKLKSSKAKSQEISKFTKNITEKFNTFEPKDIKAFVKQALKQKQNPLEVLNELELASRNLTDTYKFNVSKIQNFCQKEFENVYSVDSIGTRAKGNLSVLSKLMSKYSKGKLESIAQKDLAKGIGDGYGARIVLKSLKPERAKAIIENTLAGKMSYEDFIKNVSKFDSLDEETSRIVNKGLNKLKEYQTNEFVDKFIELLKKGSIQLADDEFNNYGNEITSYFSDTQLKRIAHNYEEITHKPLTIVNKHDLGGIKNAEEVTKEGFFKGFLRRTNFVNTNSDKATKSSGYTTTQANLKTSYTIGEPLADAEIQIRGKSVNNFAEVEHIPYDIRQGKKTDSKYDEIKTVMRGMSKDSYGEYAKYLSDTYTYHRLKELGIETKKPELTRHLVWAKLEDLPKDLQNCVKDGKLIDTGLIEKITEEGLLALHG